MYGRFLALAFFSVFFLCVSIFSTLNIQAEIAYPEILEKKYIHDIATASNGSVWIASWRILEFQNGEWTVYDTPMEGYGRKIALDENTVWVLGEGRIARFKDGEWELVLNIYSGPRNGFPNPYEDVAYYLTDIAVMESGAIWVSTEGAGLFEYDGHNWTRHIALNNDSENMLSSVDVDSNGVIWVGTLSNGLYSFDGEKWTQYTTSDGLLHDTVRDILINENSIWCATDGGISCFSDNKWKSYTTDNGLPSNYIKCITVDDKSGIWAGGGTAGGPADRSLCEWETTGGIAHYKNGIWEKYTQDDGLIKNYVGAISVDHDGAVWCGGICGCSIILENTVNVNQENIKHTILSAVYPNPANPYTTIEFEINDYSKINIKIINMLGQIVRTILNDRISPGNHKYIWNLNDDNGNPVSSGTYLILIQKDHSTETQKLSIVR